MISHNAYGKSSISLCIIRRYDYALWDRHLVVKCPYGILPTICSMRNRTIITQRVRS